MGASFTIVNNGKGSKCLITVTSLKVWYSKMLEYYTALKMVIHMLIDMPIYQYRDLLFSGKNLHILPKPI